MRAVRNTTSGIEVQQVPDPEGDGVGPRTLKNPGGTGRP